MRSSTNRVRCLRRPTSHRGRKSCLTTSGARPKPGSQPCQVRATAANSCAATSRPERHPRPARHPPSRPPSEGHRRTPVPRSHGRKRQRLKGLGKPLVRAQNGRYTRGLPRGDLTTLRDRRKPAEQTWRAPTGPDMTTLRLGFATFVTGLTACRCSRIWMYLIAADADVRPERAMYKNAFRRLSAGPSDRDCHPAQRALDNRAPTRRSARQSAGNRDCM
jgi:hypothetical protein